MALPERIAIDPKILTGKPVVRGTRLSVEFIVQLLASGCKDKTIKLWNPATAKLITTLIGHTGRIESLYFSPDSKSLASGGGGGDTSIKLWNLDSILRRLQPGE